MAVIIVAAFTPRQFSAVEALGGDDTAIDQVRAELTVVPPSVTVQDFVYAVTPDKVLLPSPGTVNAPLLNAAEVLVDAE